MGVIKYMLMFIGGVLAIIGLIGVIFTSFHSEPVSDPVEQALEEITKKKGRRK